MIMTTMTRDEALKLVADARAVSAQIDARATSRDHAPMNPDGTYTGEVVRIYSVSLRVTDPSTGNGVSRTVADGTADMAAVISEMRAELASAAKRTRAAIRAERTA